MLFLSRLLLLRYLSAGPRLPPDVFKRELGDTPNLSSYVPGRILGTILDTLRSTGRICEFRICFEAHCPRWVSIVTGESYCLLPIIIPISQEGSNCGWSWTKPKFSVARAMSYSSRNLRKPIYNAMESIDVETVSSSVTLDIKFLGVLSTYDPKVSSFLTFLPGALMAWTSLAKDSAALEPLPNYGTSRFVWWSACLRNGSPFSTRFYTWIECDLLLYYHESVSNVYDRNHVQMLGAGEEWHIQCTWSRFQGQGSSVTDRPSYVETLWGQVAAFDQQGTYSWKGRRFCMRRAIEFELFDSNRCATHTLSLSFPLSL